MHRLTYTYTTNETPNKPLNTESTASVYASAPSLCFYTTQIEQLGATESAMYVRSATHLLSLRPNALPTRK